MQRIILVGTAMAVLLMTSCGGAQSPTQNLVDLSSRKAELIRLKAQQEQLLTTIQKLETDIANEDTSFGVKPKLVNVTALMPQSFTHFIDLQGKIAPRRFILSLPGVREARSRLFMLRKAIR